MKFKQHGFPEKVHMLMFLTQGLKELHIVSDTTVKTSIAIEKMTSQEHLNNS
jgi:hypothetical protein